MKLKHKTAGIFGSPFIWLTGIVIGVVLSLLMVGAGPILRDVFQSSRSCHSPFVLRAAGDGIQIVQGFDPTANWRDLISEASTTPEKCITVRMSGSATLGEYSDLRDAADVDSVRLSVVSEE